MGAGISDHLDVVAAVDFEKTVLDAVHGWLEDTRGAWRSCTFDELGPRALLRDLAPPTGAQARIDPQSVCPVLVAAGGDLDAVVPRPQLARLRKATRRAERAGQVEIRRRDRSDDPLQTLQVLFALHAKRWELRREPGVLGDARVRRLHENVVNAFSARGAVRLYAMHLDGCPAAVVYGFREGARLHVYLQGIEPGLESLSPGTVLLGFVIADALREGVREVDFLRGGEAYKYAWGAMDEANARVCIAA
jgi:CelD/BcsL family acetyltransferase involved in cellulose biosynthesis